MSEWRRTHGDVFENINKESRDPRLLQIQQLWVYLEIHKRERVDGHTEASDVALQETKMLYETIVETDSHLPPDLLRRLRDLKHELDALLPH